MGDGDEVVDLVPLECSEEPGLLSRTPVEEALRLLLLELLNQFLRDRLATFLQFLDLEGDVLQMAQVWEELPVIELPDGDLLVSDFEKAFHIRVLRLFLTLTLLVGSLMEVVQGFSSFRNINVSSLGSGSCSSGSLTPALTRLSPEYLCMLFV